MIETLKQNEELWNLFTKKEEYNLYFSDQYDRFPYYLSGQRNVFDPNVSRFLVEKGLCPEYPDGRKFAVCLTHDIDVVYPEKLYPIIGTAKAFARGNFRDAIKAPFSRINKRCNPCWNFREIMELEAKYNAKSSFYFMALRPGEQDFNYEIEDLEAELKYISSHGWEVGLHGGHESYKNFGDILEKKQRLERVLGKQIIGYRNHFLRFRVPDTWELLSKANFKYDTTFGYADCAGFRNGMCHPYRPYNINTGKQIDILELPLIVMDRTLLRSYMRLNVKQAWELIKSLVDKVEQCNGVITVLWHNNTNIEGESLKYYEKFLKYVSGKNAWIASGEEIYNWWSTNVEPKYWEVCP
jgi:peptidoglycan/xylan/chitin deacetylase (PgdA/CDA1 family)